MIFLGRLFSKTSLKFSFFLFWPEKGETAYLIAILAKTFCCRVVTQKGACGYAWIYRIRNGIFLSSPSLLSFLFVLPLTLIFRYIVFRECDEISFRCVANVQRNQPRYTLSLSFLLFLFYIYSHFFFLHMLLKVFGLFILHITTEGDFRKVVQATKLSCSHGQENNCFTNHNILNYWFHYFSQKDFMIIAFTCYVSCLSGIFMSQTLPLRLRIAVYLKSPRSI